MSRHLALAVPLYLKALELEPRLSVACVGLAGIGRQVSDALQYDAMTRCSKIDPDSYYLALEQVTAAEPRWGGSETELREVVSRIATRVERNPQVGALLGHAAGYAPPRNGKYLLLPVINMVNMQVEQTASHPYRTTCAQMQAKAAVNNDKLVSAIVLIDGKPVANLHQHRVRSDGCFPLHVTAAGRPEAGTLLGASDGFWLLLPPLAHGKHHIVVGASSGSKDRPYGNLTQNFEYDLEVGGQTFLNGHPGQNWVQGPLLLSFRPSSMRLLF